ncbi:hypothetical protein H2248_007826 [Termitomyces sp. 'cryptogamus']|nr:hypothetical protein H2248_007826 [Termitomyces sp. 'cryptogamus']
MSKTRYKERLGLRKFQALGKLNGMVEKLGSTAEFLNANDTQRAKTTLTLKYMSKMLARVTSLLDAMASKLAKLPAQPAPTLTWVTIARASANAPASLLVSLASGTPLPSLLSANDKTWVQQQVLKDAWTVLVQINC